MRRKAQSERKINNSSHDRLSDVICQAHPAIKTQVSHYAAELFILIKQHKRRNQKKQGKDFGYRFLWRLVLLVGFATLNAAFFPAGDVLLLFAVVGLVLFFCTQLER